MMQKSTSALVVFFLITFGIAWAAIFYFYAGGFYFTGQENEKKAVHLLSWIIILTPLAAAFTVRTFFPAESEVDTGIRWGKTKFFAAAYFLPLLLIIAALVLTLVLAWGKWNPEWNTIRLLRAEEAQSITKPAWWMIFYILIQVPLLLLIPQLIQDWAWIGYLQERLMGKGATRAILLMAIIFAVWNSPRSLIGMIYEGHPFSGVPALIALMFFMGVIMGWLRYKSGSLFPSVLAHAVFVGAGKGSYRFIKDVDPIMGGILGLAGIIVLAITVVVFFRLKILSLSADT